MSEEEKKEIPVEAGKEGDKVSKNELKRRKKQEDLEKKK